MRRLAKHSREDVYATRRDYQQIKEQQTLLIKFTQPNSRLILQRELKADEEASFVGFGGYFKPSVACVVRVSLLLEGEVIREQPFELSTEWNRLGIASKYDGEEKIEVLMQFEGKVKNVFIWGIDCGLLRLPEKVSENRETTLQDLESVHVCPETFYLPHETVTNLEINADTSSAFTLEESGMIELKKCSYCGRYLPLDSRRLGALAFHRHAAKVSKHQNECRACKKWRINNDFNPTRTVDQLHESSVITRERKLLLREPEILKAIKDRRGAGLKSIIWKKFDKKCFNCDTPLELSEVRLDHTRPLAYLWPIDEFATCLCEACNNHKKERFPVDFYSEEQLRRLARITGLDFEILRTKDVNNVALNEIIKNISTFAKTWEVRTFNATARKVKELRPEIDLFETLKQADEDIYEQVISELRERPELAEEEENDAED